VNDPDLIVLQGQYVKAGEPFLHTIREGLEHVGLPGVVKNVRIECSTLGEDRGVIGGAAFAIAEFFANRLQFSSATRLRPAREPGSFEQGRIPVRAQTSARRYRS